MKAIETRDIAGLRVLHLVRSLAVGGLERMVIDLTRGLRNRGVISFLGCLIEPGEWSARACVEGQWCGRLPQKGALSTLWDLCRFIRRMDIDLIHTHNSHPHKYGVPAALLTSRPLVHTKHGRNWPDKPAWVWLSRQLSRFSQFIVPVSREIERIVLEVERVPARRVRLILNGADGQSCSPGSSPLRAKHFGSALVLGSMGRFSPEKRYHLLVEAFARVKAQLPNARLVIVGDGTERPRIEAAIMHHNLASSVLLPGMSSDITEWLRAMDIFCLTSEQEGTPVSLIEAGLCGLPAVVTSVGGNCEIVENGRTGFLVAPDDLDGFVRRVVELAQNARLRGSMGNAARERMLEQYSLDRMVDAYVTLYREVMLDGWR